MKDINLKELEFLFESNKIEEEYTSTGLQDAIKAWAYALDNRDEFSTKYILNIHKKLMERLNPEIAGQLRDCIVYIGGRICPYISEKELKRELGNWMVRCQKEGRRTGNIEEKIKNWHVEFENIHPFRDGNGRVGRILMNVQRLNYHLPLLIIHQGEEQREYYKWFKEND